MNLNLYIYYFFITFFFIFLIVCVTGVLPVTPLKKQPANRLTVHCTKVQKNMFFQTCCLEKNSWFFQTNCLILVWLFQTTLQQALLRLHSSYKQMKHVEVLFQQFCLFSFISNVFQTNGDLTFTCSL